MVVAPAPPMGEAVPQIFTPTDETAQGGLRDQRGSAPYCYWRKPERVDPDTGAVTPGDIVFGQAGANGVRTKTRLRFIMLPQYGEYPFNSGRGGWDPLIDPYLRLLEKGGIREFSAAQIKEHQWHIRPHRVLRRQIEAYEQQGLSREQALLQVMPQLAGEDLTVHRCPSSGCPRTFISQSHVDKHAGIAHKEELRNRDLQNAIAKAITGSAEGSATAFRDVILILGQNQEQARREMADMREVMAKQSEALVAIAEALAAAREDKPAKAAK